MDPKNHMSKWISDAHSLQKYAQNYFNFSITYKLNMNLRTDAAKVIK